MLGTYGCFTNTGVYMNNYTPSEGDEIGAFWHNGRRISWPAQPKTMPGRLKTKRIPRLICLGGALYRGNAISGGDGGSGPVRVGIFATNNADRVSAGASYWGIMELSGNLYERPVTIGHATGRAFAGTHGDGVLTAAGNANVSAWPGEDAAGTGIQGGTTDNTSSSRIKTASGFKFRQRASSGRRRRDCLSPANRAVRRPA